MKGVRRGAAGGGRGRRGGRGAGGRRAASSGRPGQGCRWCSGGGGTLKEGYEGRGGVGKEGLKRKVEISLEKAAVAYIEVHHHHHCSRLPSCHSGLLARTGLCHRIKLNLNICRILIGSTRTALERHWSELRQWGNNQSAGIPPAAPIVIHKFL